ncbi:PspC domain-containing protein [Angustibacter aerolatus]
MTTPPPATGPAADAGPAAAAAPARLERADDGRLVAGVAAGLARHLGVSVVPVRVAFALLAAVNGFGVAVYAALWVFAPRTSPDAGDPAALAAASRGGRRPRFTVGRGDLGQLAAFGALGVGLVLLLSSVSAGLPLRVVVPVLIAAAGLTLLWVQADVAERAGWLQAAPGGQRLAALSSAPLSTKALVVARVVGGVALVVLALVTFLVGSGRLDALRESFLLLLVVFIGLGLVVGPFLWRLVRQLDDERRERLLSQQRADVAAHLHDSVLQTLALIQRRADDPRAVRALARGQERDLRGWLFEPETQERTTLRPALEAVATEAEQAHGVPVELVVVGDADLDANLQALVRATREAVANAARHSEAPSVDVYAEVVDGQVEVFVRDRGVGFDPAAVPDDRMGLKGSVIGRVERHGGTARVRSTPGEGAEVALTMKVGHGAPQREETS